MVKLDVISCFFVNAIKTIVIKLCLFEFVSIFLKTRKLWGKIHFPYNDRIKNNGKKRMHLVKDEKKYFKRVLKHFVYGKRDFWKFLHITLNLNHPRKRKKIRPTWKNSITSNLCVKKHLQQKHPIKKKNIRTHSGNNVIKIMYAAILITVSVFYRCTIVIENYVYLTWHTNERKKVKAA